MTWWRFPFGKFRNVPLESVPDDYLRWALRSCDSLTETDKTHLRQELQRRTDAASGPKSSGYKGSPPPLRPSRLPVAVKPDMALEIVRAGRRALASQYHPDRGGDSEIMIAVNATADHLEKSLPALLGGAA